MRTRATTRLARLGFDKHSAHSDNAPRSITLPDTNLIFRNDGIKVTLWALLAVLNVLSMCFLLAAHVIEPGIMKTERDLETGVNKIVVGDSRVDLRDYRAKFCRETDTCIEK